MMKTLLCVAVLCLAFKPSHSQDFTDWIKAVNSKEGESISFNCTEANNPRDDPNTGDPALNITEGWTITAWMLPDFTRIYADKGKYVLSNNLTTLTINDVTPDEFGVYHCMLVNTTDTEHWGMVKWGLNMRGPYFEDLWKKYDTNVMIAFLAMFGFLLLAGSIFALYRFRYRAPVEIIVHEDDMEMAPKKMPSSAQDVTAEAETSDLDDTANPEIQANEVTEVQAITDAGDVNDRKDSITGTKVQGEDNAAFEGDNLDEDPAAAAEESTADVKGAAAVLEATPEPVVASEVTPEPVVTSEVTPEPVVTTEVAPEPVVPSSEVEEPTPAVPAEPVTPTAEVVVTPVVVNADGTGMEDVEDIRL